MKNLRDLATLLENNNNNKILLQAVLAAQVVIVQNWKSLAQLNLAHWYSTLSELAGIGKLVFLINNNPKCFFQVILTVFLEICNYNTYVNQPCHLDQHFGFLMGN